MKKLLKRLREPVLQEVSGMGITYYIPRWKLYAMPLFMGAIFIGFFVTMCYVMVTMVGWWAIAPIFAPVAVMYLITKIS